MDSRRGSCNGGALVAAVGVTVAVSLSHPVRLLPRWICRRGRVEEKTLAASAPPPPSVCAQSVTVMATAGGGAYGYPLGRPPGTGSAAVAIPSRRGAAPASDAAGLAVNAAGLAVDATVAGGSPLGTPPFVRLCGATLDGLRGLDDGGGGRAGGDGRLECFSVVSVSDGDLSSVGSSPPCVSSSLDTASLGFPPSLLSSGLFAAPWTSGGSVFEVAGTRTDALCEGAHGTAPPPPPLTGFVRRGAMDIGTSSHKLLVADVHTPSGTVLPVAVYEVRVPLGASLLAAAERERNGGGSGGRTEGGGPDSRSLLPPDALAASAAAVSTLAAAAATAGVPPGATGGVATAAFRRSANGAAHLAAVGARHALRLMVVDAAAEGELALLTVAASLGLSGPALGNGLGGAGGLPPGLVVWDSGGGSFQLAAAAPGGRAGLDVYQGGLGSADAAAAWATLTSGGTEPAGAAHVTALLRVLTRRIVVDGGGGGAAAARVAAAARCGTGAGVVGVGGDRSLFAIAATAVGVVDGAPITVGGVEAALWAAASDLPGGWRRRRGRRRVAAPDGAEAGGARSAAVGEVSPPPSLPPAEVERVVVRLALLLAVMRTLGVDRVRYVRATGVCGGVALWPPLWGEAVAEVGCA